MPACLCNGRGRPRCPSGDLSCQIFHADKNLVDEQNRGMIHILPPPGCAAALTQPSTQQVKLSLGSTQARCTILKTAVKCRRRWSGVGVNCRAVYQSFCFRVASNMRCDQARSALYNLTLTKLKSNKTGPKSWRTRNVGKNISGCCCSQTAKPGFVGVDDDCPRSIQKTTRV